MSSIARRIQIDIMKRKGLKKVPVLNETTGNVMRWNWPPTGAEVALKEDGRDATQCVALKPLVDILLEDRRRNIEQ